MKHDKKIDAIKNSKRQKTCSSNRIHEPASMSKFVPVESELSVQESPIDEEDQNEVDNCVTKSKSV